LDLATLIGVLALTARILLLLAGLLAAALLLAGLLARVLGLLARVLILSAHSGISLARGSLRQPSILPLVAKEHCSRVCIGLVRAWRPEPGTKLALYKASWPQPMLLPPLVPAVRK
jgi:hypothetical protein